MGSPFHRGLINPTGFLVDKQIQLVCSTGAGKHEAAKIVDLTSTSNIHKFMFDDDCLIARREIGARIRKRRKELGLTQCEIAEALNHKSSHRINQIELGRLRLYAEELPELCRALKCDAADIISPRTAPGKSD